MLFLKVFLFIVFLFTQFFLFSHAVILWDPFFTVFELILMNITLNNPILVNTASSHVKQKFDIVHSVMILLNMRFEAFVLQVEIKPFLSTYKADSVLILLDVLLFLPQL